MLKVIDWIEGEEVNKFTRSGIMAGYAVEQDKAKFEAAGHFVESGYDDDKGAFWLIKDCGDNCRWYYDVEGGMLAFVYRNADEFNEHAIRDIGEYKAVEVDREEIII